MWNKLNKKSECAQILIGAAVLVALGTVPRSGHAQQSADSAAPAEVLVTAQKRDERLQDVPVPVAVLNTDSLAENGQFLLRDYYASVPGLNFSPNYAGGTTLTIRGVAADAFGNPTVAVLIDDLVFTTSTTTDGNNVPEIDPGDLDHLEVLRGPQGTLYGANSMGGIVKYTTKDPSTDSLSGRIEAGTNTIHNGAEPGYSLRGSANVPLTDTLAVRVSAFTRQDPGYIDDVATREDGVNKGLAVGGRIAALWKPMEDFSIKLTALDQATKLLGQAEINQPTAGFPRTEGLGDLQQNYMPNTGESYTSLQAYSATIKAKVAGIDVTSLTGYNANRGHNTFDGSSVFGACCVPGAFDGNTGAPFEFTHFDTKFTQELRFNVSFGSHFDLLVGGFYTRETTRLLELISGANINTGEILGTLYYSNTPTGYREYAGFTDLTYHVTDRFDIQVGGRESAIRASTFESQSGGALTGYTTVIGAPQSTDAHPFTYLVTPRYKLTDDVMVYARFASGYRPGSSNAACFATTTLPCQYSPDRTHNYELGLKSDLFDHMLTLNASLYYISWKDIQIQLTGPAPAHSSYVSNGSAAKSEGVELEATVRPTSGLSISGWITYDDAVLTQNFPADSAVAGSDGDRLPFSTRYSANLSIEQDFPLTSEATGFVGAAGSYIGDRVNIFTAAGQPRVNIPGYVKTDLRAGLRYNTWTTNLYVNNVADRRGVLNNDLANGNFPYASQIIPPRMVGISVAKIL